MLNNKTTNLTFKYDSVLHNCSQEEVYEKVVRDVVSRVMQGTNGTIMAYGQTGSGKSHTILGTPTDYRNRGIAPRAISQVFACMAEKPEIDYSIAVSYMEIYNDKIIDLLEKSRYAAAMRGAMGSSAVGVLGGGSAGAAEAGEFNIIEDPVHGEGEGMEQGRELGAGAGEGGR